MTTFDLERFISAQDLVYSTIVGELRNGMKASHWMWFVFPQIDGLGSSQTARHYAIRSLDEADSYLAHPVLGSRLIECTELVNNVEGKSLRQIFGSPDDMKFHSSVTLFSLIERRRSVFEQALDKYFDGELDERTMAIVGPAGDDPGP
ncbi:MAG: DUF1810 domain-containing protein [Ilumatobacteraceae bacterium]|nr:DUF1810 domain-containing protein [Ilumatobacteraceae bacterium]